MKNTDRARWDILLSPPYLLCLFLLLLNDFVLKAKWGNALTGKLSDVAGLFIFPLFFTVFLPELRLPIFVATAGLFVFWKSALATSIIASWNNLSFFPINRTPDVTDLFALGILPIAYWQANQCRPFQPKKISRLAILTLSVCAITATSYSPYKTQVSAEYEFDCAAIELVRRLEMLSGSANFSQHIKDANDPIHFGIHIKEGKGAGVITQYHGKTKISLLWFETSTKTNRDVLLTAFAQKVISPLFTVPVRKSSAIESCNVYQR